jgi:hypothetical protein
MWLVLCTCGTHKKIELLFVLFCLFNWASLERGKIDFGAKFGGEGREKNEEGEARGEGEMRLSL